ncbi:unnamed protein product, partial [Meganyctiphanes norvegica]
ERDNVNQNLDDAAVISITEYIHSSEEKIKNLNIKEIFTEVKGAKEYFSDRKNRKNRCSGSRSPDRRKRRSVSKSPDRRYRQSRSKSEDRIYRKARSRSTDRRYQRSRSRSTERRYRRSRSRERRCKGSGDLEKNPARQKNVYPRSPSNETKSYKRKKYDAIEQRKETDNDLYAYGFSDTDIAILDKDDFRLKSILTKIFTGCGGKSHMCDLFYRFKSRQQAQLVYRLVNKFRTPLSRVKLVCSQKVDILCPEDSQESMLVMDIINKILKKYQQININVLKDTKTQKDTIDPYLFKTKRCELKICQNKKECICYHNEDQRRRKPSKFLYTADVCLEYRLGSCPYGSRCKKSHSEYEFIFHPDKVHKKVCSDWCMKNSCQLDFELPNCCINAHPETPEVLFNDVWCDLYISELKHTYRYLVGAIHNLRFVNIQCDGVYVLLVTPSIYMIHWLIEATKKLAKDLKLDINMVMNDIDITEKETKSKVLLCTPDGAIRLLKTQGLDLSHTIAGLILDDVTLLLHRHKNELDIIGKTLMHSSPCLVAVADKVYSEDVNNLSAMLYTQFSIVGTVSSSKQREDLPSSSTIDSYLSSSKNIKQVDSSTATVAQGSNSGSKDIQKNHYEFSPIEACEFLMCFCDKIGVLGYSLRMVLEKTVMFGNDSNMILESLCDSEIQELFIIIDDKLKNLREETQDEILLAVYAQANIAINFLMESTKLHLETSKLDVEKLLGSPGISKEKSQYERNKSPIYNKDKSYDQRSSSPKSHSNARSNEKEPASISDMLKEIGEDCLGDTEREPLSISDMLEQIGESFNMDIGSSLPKSNHEHDSGNERRIDGTTQIYQNAAGFSSSFSDSSQRIRRTMFKVAIFGHEYANLLPFYSGETFNSKTPGSPYQVLKYIRNGAEIYKVHEYSIWNEVISDQPHMIFLILGKNDISEYVSPQKLADRMVRIKNELEKRINNVRIICFGLENHQSDDQWSSYQDKLNRCLGMGFDTFIFPTAQIDIGDNSSEAVKRVWVHIQGIIEDIQLQQIMLPQHHFLPNKGY